ncbi:hypothetical protein NLJ89_g3582 [Agrocybe chaxingu]|uniref:Uncharacterized protein n=1 Tax=Agrocybe chaxingu TaxID=84603 RepID=A0A9W8K4C3_9AGAR|nr:hypothetical protein NLJ89_g3582 [Agrocybe chaxingu]
MRPNQTVSASPLGQNAFEPTPIRSTSISGDFLLSASNSSRTSTKWDNGLSYVRGLESLVNEGKDDVERLNLLQSQSSRDLADLRARLASTTQDLQTAKSEINTLRSASDASKEGLTVKDCELRSLQAALSQVKEELASSLAENGRLKEDVWGAKTETENVKQVLEKSKRSVASLSSEYSILGTYFKELKEARDIDRERLKEISSEVQALRKTANNAMSALEPMLDDNNTLTRAAETKALLKQLQEDLAGSHQVTDMLRNKLLHNASQLADAQNRVRELEEEKRGWLHDLVSAREDEKRQFESFAEVEKRMSELSVRLAAREKETIDTLAYSDCVRNELETVKRELSFHQSIVSTQGEELGLLRSLKEQNVSKLLEFQDVVNSRDKEIVMLRSEVKSLAESREELRALMAEAKKSLAEKEVELRAKDPNEEYQIEISNLRSENRALKTTVQETQTALKAANKASHNAEQHFNKTLHELEKLVVELRSKIGMLQTAFEKSQDELRIAQSKASVADGKALVLQEDMHVVKKHSESLTAEIAELRERLEAQSLNLYQAKEHGVKLKERLDRYVEQLDDKTSLNEALGKQAALAESSAASAQAFLKQALKDHKSKVAELTAELASVKEAALLGAKTTTTELEQETTRLREKLAKLERLNSELIDRAANIKSRYNDADLTDTERDFIRHLMSEAQSMHEEEMVLKDNELRGRQNMIEALKSKVAELQGTLARLLKEKGAAPGASNKAMVDFKVFMSSSPEQVTAEEAPLALNGDQEVAGVPPGVPSNHPQGDVVPPLVWKTSSAAEKTAVPPKQSLPIQKKVESAAAKPKQKKRKEKKAHGDA